jgi:carbonic anhydrase
MKKLVQGLLDFQRHGLPAYRSTFARLAHGQAPDCLFIACADSRVVPNLFASTNPGDLFVMRNVGNLVPPLRRGVAVIGLLLPGKPR